MEAWELAGTRAENILLVGREARKEIGVTRVSDMTPIFYRIAGAESAHPSQTAFRGTNKSGPTASTVVLKGSSVLFPHLGARYTVLELLPSILQTRPLLTTPGAMNGTATTSLKTVAVQITAA